MFVTRIRPLLDPSLEMLARRLACMGLSGDHFTFAGLALGILAGLAIVAGRFAAALDGPVARAAGTVIHLGSVSGRDDRLEAVAA